MEAEIKWMLGTPMTDKELKQLIDTLKNYQGYDRELRRLVHEAAGELERLAAEVKRLDWLLDAEAERSR